MPALASAEEPQLNWSWDDGVHHRFFIENEVHLPVPVMLYAELNTQARMVATQTQMVIDCASVREKRKEWELECAIEDISLIGAGMTGDRGTLGEVLDEVDERLTGATLQISLKKNGRIRQVDLEGLDRRNRRLSQNVEQLRLLMIRGVAGLDFQFARTRADEITGWPQYDSLLMATPYNRGNQGTAEMVHRLREPSGDSLIVDSVGRGVAAQATDSATGPANTYMMQLSSTSLFDAATGALSQRRWTVIGEPTAGSAVNDGVAGVSYLQAGQVVRLSAGEHPTLNASAQSLIPGATEPSAIQQWVPIPSLGQ